ncbi:hypothetical protein ACHQM5_028909 [Ranunculus cassubicifolius]
MLPCKSLPIIFTILFLFSSFIISINGSFSKSQQFQIKPLQDGGLIGVDEYGVVVTRRIIAEETVNNSSLILAAKRTYRRDPLEDFKRYTGGWNITEKHYWASVGFTAAPLFVIAIVWFIVFGLTLSLVCCCYCCCPHAPYGYSRTAYALSLILLILFTVAAIVGCIVLYTGQGKFDKTTGGALDYIVQQSNETAEMLTNVSDYLSAAKRIGVARFFLGGDIQTRIDDIDRKINSSATTLSVKTKDNAHDIKHVLHIIKLCLVIIAAVMLLLAFVGFLLSIFGMKTLVSMLVIVGWILVAGTFILCGVFLLLHNVVSDTCVAMDEWVKNPTAHTALDDILPCVDNATAEETLQRSKQVSSQLVDVANQVITNLSNVNLPSAIGPPLYFNQSGPLVPILCNPYHPDLTTRECSKGEVALDNATQVWKNYVCEVSSAGACTTVGRLTPDYYEQMSAAVNVSYGLYRYGPKLVQLEDCTFVRDTFMTISVDHCPKLRKHVKLIYTGLLMVSAAVMLSLIFWVIYARERRHRVYTKHVLEGHGRGPFEENKG